MLLKYLDTRKATIAALRDWHIQHWKAEQGREYIKRINEQLISVPLGMGEVCPSTRYAKNTEASFTRQFDKKDLVMRSYEQSFEYVEKMDRCWETLSERQQKLLTLRYIDHEERDGISKIMSIFNVSKSEAYRMSDAALTKLQKELYW